MLTKDRKSKCHKKSSFSPIPLSFKRRENSFVNFILIESLHIKQFVMFCIITKFTNTSLDVRKEKIGNRGEIRKSRRLI